MRQDERRSRRQHQPASWAGVVAFGVRDRVGVKAGSE